jgi:hypothetical protein
VQARLGRIRRTEIAGAGAALVPANEAAHFNLGLLRRCRATRFRGGTLAAALKSDPRWRRRRTMGLLVVGTCPARAVNCCASSSPASTGPRYAYTLAFYLSATGDRGGAIHCWCKSWPNIRTTPRLRRSCRRGFWRQGVRDQARLWRLSWGRTRIEGGPTAGMEAGAAGDGGSAPWWSQSR